jgi:hypothetical protein
VRLRVQEVLHSEASLEPGEEVEAATDGMLPCYRGMAAVTVGEDALAQIHETLPGLTTCNAGTCADGSTFDPTRHGGVRLSEWSEQIAFAQTDQAQLLVPANELSRLWGDQEECLDRGGACLGRHREAEI